LNLLPNNSFWVNLGLMSGGMVSSCSLFLLLSSFPHYPNRASSKLQKLNLFNCTLYPTVQYLQSTLVLFFVPFCLAAVAF